MHRDRGRYRVHWTVDGKRRTKSFSSPDEAQLFELKIKMGEIASNSPILDKPLTFAEFCDVWMTRHVIPLKSPSQQLEDRSRVRTHLLPVLGETLLTNLTLRHTLTVREALLTRKHPKTKAPISPRTINAVLATMKHITKKALVWGYLEKDPSAGLEYVPTAEQDFDYWTPDERDRFWRRAQLVDKSFAQACIVAAFTGLRRGELAALDASQIDWHRNQIKVNASYCYRAGRRLPRTKNHRMGYVPMVPEVREVLSTISLSPFFGPELLRHSSQRLAALCKKTEVKEIRFHDLRHTFASCLAMAGVPIYTVQRLMRHETAAMTQRYSHLAPDHLADAIHALSRSSRKDFVTCENHSDDWSRRPDLNMIPMTLNVRNA